MLEYRFDIPRMLTTLPIYICVIAIISIAIVLFVKSIYKSSSEKSRRR